MAEVRSWDVAVERGLVDLRRHYREVQLELLEVLTGLPATAWTAPTVLPGWDVHSVALHLLGADIGRVSSSWHAGAVPGRLDPAGLATEIEQSNEQWVGATRRIAPPLLVDLLRLLADRTALLWADADLWAPATAVAWAGAGPSPLWLDIGREYTERWVHQQQIREAVSAPLLEEPRWLGPVIDLFMLCLPRAYAAVRAPIGTSISFELTGSAGGRWDLVCDDDRWHLGPGTASAHAATMSLTTDVAWRWLAGLLPRRTVGETARMAGDRGLTEAALGAVAVMTTAV